MKFNDLCIRFGQVAFLLFVLWLNFSPTDESPPQTLETIVTSRGGNAGAGSPSSEISNKSDEKQFFREMLKAYFPDRDDRVNYQKKQEKFYKSARAKFQESKRLRLSNESFLKLLTVEEKDALDYFNGAGFYEKPQNSQTLPNVFDTRKSFLLKMENEKMRNQFLKAYNRDEGYKIVIEPNP